MTTSVVHQPRVAWDLAQTTVAMAEADDEAFGWYAGQFEQCLGPSMRHELQLTRLLLPASRRDVRLVELGRWRVRIEDALAEQPQRAEALTRLRAEALTRLRLEAGSRLAR